jgi:transcriptional regulator with PAS, ATPase and Fis domain
MKAYIRRIAPTNCNVLVTGETGTGKECVAKLIHDNSQRRHRPFACINCAAIPDSLLESELFGFEKGAFTGANSRYAGRVVLADKGTLFLDEIGDMTLLAQAKILRLVEGKEVLHLGGTRASTVDVRVIAATNCDLDAAAVNSRTFRSDLYYRLNVARIHLPPLRDRRNDIPLLFTHFVRHYAAQFSSSVEGCTEEMTDALARYDWPGNIRELKNVVEAILLNGPSGRIGMPDVPQPFRNRLTSPPSHVQIGAKFLAERIERDGIRERLIHLLRHHNGNVTRVSESVGKARVQIHRWARRYRIDIDSFRRPL